MATESSEQAGDYLILNKLASSIKWKELTLLFWFSAWNLGGQSDQRRAKQVPGLESLPCKSWK